MKKVIVALKAYLIAPYRIWHSDILHIHVASRNSWRRKFPLIVLGRVFRRLLIVHVHGGGFGDFLGSMGPWRSWLTRKALRLADCVVCLSSRKRDEIAGYLGPVRTVTIPNPCTFIPVSVDRDQRGRITVLFTGWILKEKGVFDLVRAFTLLTERCPGRDLSLVVAGKGAVNECRELTHELHLDGKVDFPGWLGQDALREAYSRAHIYCLPSYVEGVPMAILEAMAFGLPIVTCPVGGIPDVMREGTHGLFAGPGDAFGLATALRRLVENRSERERMGVACRDEILGNYSIEKVGREVADLYRSLASCAALKAGMGDLRHEV